MERATVRLSLPSLRSFSYVPLMDARLMYVEEPVVILSVR